MSGWPQALSFVRPEAGWLLLPWCLLVWRVWTTGRRGKGETPGDDTSSPWAGVIDTELLQRLEVAALLPPAETRSVTPGGVRRWATTLIGLLLILALSGPQLKRTGHAAKPLRPDVARVLVADLSPAYGRLSDEDRRRLRTELRQFVRHLPAGETALLVAAGNAWLVVPPTEDLMALDGFLLELSPDVVPVPGDNPQAALTLARKTLAATGAREQVILWLRAGDPPPLIESQSGIQPIFLQVAAGQGAADWHRVLAANAQSRPGNRWQATALNVLPPSDSDRIDLGPLLILIALPLTVGLLRGAPGMLVLPLVFLLGSACPAPAAAASEFEQAVAAYRAGRHDEAAALFLRSTPEDPRAFYNRGNALALAGRLSEALTAYDASLRLRPGDVSTLHNRALVASLLQSPPPSSSRGTPPPPAPRAAEAERAAEQWLRRPPADQSGLLKRKLALEERRRNGQSAP